AGAGEGVGAGLAAGALPVRATDSSTLNLSSRSLAATFFAVSASRYAPTCTQNGLAPVAGREAVVVDEAAARLGAVAGFVAAAGLTSSFGTHLPASGLVPGCRSATGATLGL